MKRITVIVVLTLVFVLGVSAVAVAGEPAIGENGQMLGYERATNVYPGWGQGQAYFVHNFVDNFGQWLVGEWMPGTGFSPGD